MFHPDELHLFTSDEELSHPMDSPSATQSPPISVLVPTTPARSSTPTNSARRRHTPRSSPPPARPPQTPGISTPAQLTPTGPSSTPDITKQTVNGLLHALGSTNIHFSCRQSKVQLYALYTKSLSGDIPPTVPPTRPQKSTSRLSNRARLASFNSAAETASDSSSISCPAAAPALAPAPATVMPAPQHNSAGLKQRC